MDDTRTDQELVAGVRDGDQAAFAVLFERWADRSYDVARRILHDEGRAAEVTQEVFTVAWQQLDSLRDPAAFGGWVLRTARNKALDRLRHEQRAVATDDASPTLRDLPSPGSVEADVAALEHQELVWAASRALGERDASVLDLHLRHDLSVPEIAEELGVTTNNAHQLLHRMKQRLGAGIRAYVLVRGGDASCPGLRQQLADAGVGGFGPEAVRVIGQHVRSCDDCDRRQAALLAPESLFAAIPIAAMTPLLRDQVRQGLQASGIPAAAIAGTGAPAATSPTGSRAGSSGGGSGPAATTGPGNGAGPSSGSGSGSGSGSSSGAGGGSGSGGGADGTPGGTSAAGGRRRARILAAAGAAVVLLLVVAFFATRSDPDDTEVAGPRSTTTVLAGADEDASTTTRPPTSTTPPTTTTPAGGDLVGAWVADASAILGANTANVGGAGGLACRGPITMTFGDDGTFDRSGDVTCSAGGLSRSGRIASTGRYEASGGELRVQATTSTGTIPDSFGDGAATYAIAGDTLTVTFTETPVGTVTQTYQRP